MTKKSILTNTWCLILVSLFFLPVASCSAKNDSSMQENPSEEATAYPVPADKAPLWESMKNVALKDYDICQEHCGYEQNCLDRCETVYKSRLEREYMMLLEKMGPASEK